MNLVIIRQQNVIISFIFLLNWNYFFPYFVKQNYTETDCRSRFALLAVIFFRKAILLNTCVIMLRSLFLYVIQCENKIQFFHLINWITWVCTHKIVVVVVTDDQKFFLVVLSFLIYARIQKLSEDIEEETLIRYMHYYHSLYNHNFRWWFKVKFMLYNENYTIVCALYSGVTM